MKAILTFTCALVLCSVSFGRRVAHWPYDKLTAEADLIVIATPVAVRDTQEKVTLPGFQQRGADNMDHPLPAISVETTFEALSVLKGDKNAKTILLHHLRLEVPILENGPGLVTFNPEAKKCFLLFLKRESDGRYSPVTGQTDPDGAVKDLGTH